MAKKPSLTYSQRATRLRKLKLLPDHYSINELGDSEKRHIRRLEQLNKPVIENPNKYRRVKVDTANARKLKSRGFTVNKNYLYIDSKGAKTVRYRKSDETLIFDFGNRQYTAYPYDTELETMTRIDSFFDARKPGEHMSLKIGDNNLFHRANVTRRADLDAYLDQFKPKTKTAWDHLMIVEIKPVTVTKKAKRKPKGKRK